MKIVVIKPKEVYHFFFECPCYDVERHTLFECISYMGLHQPVTLNMLLCGDNTISQSENIALFNFIHTCLILYIRYIYLTNLEISLHDDNYM